MPVLPFPFTDWNQYSDLSGYLPLDEILQVPVLPFPFTECSSFGIFQGSGITHRGCSIECRGKCMVGNVCSRQRLARGTGSGTG